MPARFWGTPLELAFMHKNLPKYSAMRLDGKADIAVRDLEEAYFADFPMAEGDNRTSRALVNMSFDAFL